MNIRKEKSFNNLSKRQQRRRVNKSISDMMNQSFNTLNNVNKKMSDSIIQVNMPCKNIRNNSAIIHNSSFNNCNLQPDYNFQHTVNSIIDNNIDNDSDDDDDDNNNFDGHPNDNLANNFIYSHFHSTLVHLQFPNVITQNQEIDKVQSLTSFIKTWHVKHKITREASDDLLHGLHSITGYNIPVTIRSIINTPRNNKNVVDHESGKFIYYGIEKALLDRFIHIDVLKISSTLDLYINVDGLPIFKSSKSEFWPILGKVLHIPCFAEPFIIAIYHGISKPSSLDQYLHDFCKEYKLLNEKGFNYKNRNFKINIKGFLADTPAKNFLRSFCSHTSRCGECIQKGKTIHHCRVFLEMNSPLRTDDNFRYDIVEKYKNTKSPLEDIGISMTKDFPLDYMHLVCLGVQKKLLLIYVQLLKGSDQNENKEFTTFNNFFISLSSYIPSEFVRKPRCLKEVNRWKATEFRLFLLYLGPVVLRSILPEPLLIHFNTLSCAIRTLCDPKECRKNYDYANELLNYFVENMQILYGDVSLIYNVHNLIHITKYVLDHGHLDEFSVFCFENVLQKLKNMIKTGNLPLQQAMNRIIEKSKIFTVKDDPFFQFKLLKKVTKESALPEDCNNEYQSIEFATFKLTNTTPNNCCYLRDNTVVFITAICHYKNDPVIVGRTLINPVDLENYLCDSRSLGIYKVEEISNLKIWPITQITRKGFAVVNYDSCYVSPILHSDL